MIVIRNIIWKKNIYEWHIDNVYSCYSKYKIYKNLWGESLMMLIMWQILINSIGNLSIRIHTIQYVNYDKIGWSVTIDQIINFIICIKRFIRMYVYQFLAIDLGRFYNSCALQNDEHRYNGWDWMLKILQAIYLINPSPRCWNNKPSRRCIRNLIFTIKLVSFGCSVALQINEQNQFVVAWVGKKISLFLLVAHLQLVSNATFMVELVHFRVIYYQHKTLIRIIRKTKNCYRNYLIIFYRFGSYFYAIIFLLAIVL